MKRYLILIFAICFTLSPNAQRNKAVKKASSSTVVRKKGMADNGKKDKNGSTSKNKKSNDNTGKNKKNNKNSGKRKKANNGNSALKGLQNQRVQIRRNIKLQEQKLQENKADVAQRLQNLMSINNDIVTHQKSITGIQGDINVINGNINILRAQLATLQQQLDDCKRKFVKSMRYMSRHRTIQDKLMFIFSSQSLTQAYRRLRFVREYATYQRAQGEMIKAKQNEIYRKNKQLAAERGNKNKLLYKGQQERAALQSKQAEQQTVVASLQQQQQTIQTILTDQRKKDAALNAQIDRLIAEEVAKARARAAAEAKRAAAAAAAKQKAAELARKKAAAEAEARENARKVAAAKAAEARLKAAALAAAKKNAAEKAAAEQAAREAEANRMAVERKAAAEKRRNEIEVAKAKKESASVATMSSVDRQISGSFEHNRGRLPMPITGSYRIVSHFGQYNVEGLKNVTLDNKGINIMGQGGACARSVYEGEVSAVFGFSGTMVVMVRHGDYISVYCNLRSVSVHRGQHVGTAQVLGAVGADNILQFQLRRGTAKLNPEAWIGR